MGEAGLVCTVFHEYDPVSKTDAFAPIDPSKCKFSLCYFKMQVTVSKKIIFWFYLVLFYCSD